MKRALLIGAIVAGSAGCVNPVVYIRSSQWDACAELCDRGGGGKLEKVGGDILKAGKVECVCGGGRTVRFQDDGRLDRVVTPEQK